MTTHQKPTMREFETYSFRPVTDKTTNFTLEYADPDHNLYNHGYKTCKLQINFERMAGAPWLSILTHETTYDKNGKASTRTTSATIKGDMLTKLKAFVNAIDENTEYKKPKS